MGRPINKKYFGNRNIGSLTVTTDDGIGGQGVGSVVVSGTFSGKTTTVSGAANPYTIPASVISAPQLPGGVKPTLTITFATASTATVTVVDGGSGYTAIPTISGAALQALGGGAGTVVLTAVLAIDSGSVGSDTNDENAIIAYAWVAGQREIVDIVKQSGSRSYTVKGADGTVYRAKLTAADSAADGEMDLTATDVNSNTYYVTKLTERRAKLTRKVGGSNYVYADNESAPWSFDAAAGIYVQIDNA